MLYRKGLKSKLKPRGVEARAEGKQSRVVGRVYLHPHAAARGYSPALSTETEISGSLCSPAVNCRNVWAGTDLVRTPLYLGSEQGEKQRVVGGW